MNLARVARLLAGLVLFFSVVQAAPLAFAFGEPRAPFDTRAGFAGSIAVGLSVAALLYLAGRRAPREFHRREGVAVVAFGWLLAGGLGGIPFVWSGVLPNGVDAAFESFSGLTTTGASVFGASGTPTVESLPDSLLFWRALMNFLGGVGIVLVFIILLPAMGVTGKNLLASEQTGVTTELGEPRLLEQARALFRCYLVLNVACALAYLAVGLAPFDAVCHAFTTIATGGYSTRNLSLGAFDSAGVEIVAIVGMALGGCNFAWLVALVRHRGRDAAKVLRQPELQCYFATLCVGLLIATLALWLGGHRVPNGDGVRDYGGFGRCLRDAAFNVVSVFTSTGFATADYQSWPALALLVLFYGMLVGGCTGSTSGGLKVLRVVISAKLATFHGRRFMRPKSVERLKLGGEVLADPVVSAVLAMVVLWLALVGIGAMVYASDGRLHLQDCLTVSAAMLGNTGPALSPVVVADGTAQLVGTGALNLGPYGSYGDLPASLKLWACLQMVVGRLELMVLLVLLSPRFWRS